MLLRLALLAALAPGALALTAPAAHAWPTTTLAVPDGVPLDAAALGHGPPALLVTRRLATEHTLELRVGDERTVIARDRHQPAGALDHDARGAPTVVFVPPRSPDGRRGVGIWSRAGAELVATPDGQPPALAALDVAPDGSAVVAWSGADGGWAARRAPGAARFGAPEPIGPRGSSLAALPAALPGGGAVVLLGGRAAVRAPSAATPFGEAQALALPAGVRATDHQRVVASGDGVVIVLRTSASRNPMMGAPRTVVAVPWARDAATPAAARVLSRTALPGQPAAVPAGGGVAVAFKEEAPGSGDRTAATLRALFLDAAGRTVAAHALPDAGPVAATVVAAPEGDGGVRVHFRRHTVFRSVAFTPRRGAGPVSTVTRGQGIRTLLPLELDGRPAALWQVPQRDGEVALARLPRGGS